MDELPTAKNYSGVHTLHAVCRDPACDHWQQLDLAAIVAAGHGNVPLVHLPLRCSLCGRTGHERNQSQRQVLRIGRVGLFNADYTPVDLSLQFFGVSLKLKRPDRHRVQYLSDGLGPRPQGFERFSILGHKRPTRRAPVGLSEAAIVSNASSPACRDPAAFCEGRGGQSVGYTTVGLGQSLARDLLHSPELCRAIWPVADRE